MAKYLTTPQTTTIRDGQQREYDSLISVIDNSVNRIHLIIYIRREKNENSRTRICNVDLHAYKPSVGQLNRDTTLHVYYNIGKK